MSLEHKQFEINGIAFGPRCAVDIELFEDGGLEPGNQDTDISRQDMRAFGVDSLSPNPWHWTLFTGTAETFAEGQEDLKALATTWQSEDLRRITSAVTPLKYARRRIVDGVEVVDTRVVFGRPRRWVPDNTAQIDQGLFRVDADFVRADSLFYSDVEDATSITAPASVPSGFTVPFTMPLFTTQPPVPVVNTIAPSGGDAPSPFTAEFVGPITNPTLSNGSWKIEYQAAIPAGETVTVSTYPWGLRATTSDGANVSGRLSTSTRLARLRLSQHGETLQYNGQDATGTSLCYIRWRAAFKTI